MLKAIQIDRSAVYQLQNAAIVCGISVNALQTAIKAGRLPATKRGLKTYLEGEALWRWITGRPQTDDSAKAVQK